MTQLSDLKLFERELYAQQNLKPIESELCIVWEDQIDEPSKVTTPSPMWWAMALKGGYLPDISAYLEDKAVVEKWLEETPELPFSWDAVGGAKHPSAKPRGPMTEEEAIEYLAQMTLPTKVLNEAKSGNSLKLIICKRSQVPTNRENRNAWAINQDLKLKDFNQ